MREVALTIVRMEIQIRKEKIVIHIKLNINLQSDNAAKIQYSDDIILH